MPINTKRLEIIKPGKRNVSFLLMIIGNPAITPTAIPKKISSKLFFTNDIFIF